MKSVILVIAQLVLALILYTAGVFFLGLALYPSIKMISWVWSNTAVAGHNIRLLYLSLALVFGYFLFGLSSMMVVGLIPFLLRIILREGDYKIGEPMFVKWYCVNALFLLVRIVFMDFMLLTPFCSFFYRLMGAKLGLNVQINSKNVSDHSLLEIGDNSVIGGNATVVGHSFERHGLRLAKVKIGRNVIIGMNAIVFPGVTIGDKAVVAAGAVVPKGTVIEAGMVYFGPKQN